MSKVFVVTNQHGHFLNKHREWVDGRDPKLLFRSTHKDEAINLVFEMSTRDIYLRAEAIQVELDKRDQPVVEVTTELPPDAPPRDVGDGVEETTQTGEAADTEKDEDERELEAH